MPDPQPLQYYQFREFYSSHNDWLQRWLRKKLGCPQDAADLMQDTFVHLLKTDLDSIVEPRAYLTTIAHRLMVSHIRRREVERSYISALACLPPAEAPSPEAQAIALETLLNIDRMLDGLSYKVRYAFLLYQLEELSHAQIADMLKVSISSVRQYIAKAYIHCLSV